MMTFLRNLIVRDFWLKLFSCALAVLIWFTVNFAVQNETPPVPLPSLVPEQRRFADLPVLIVSAAEAVRPLRVNPKSVEVTVQGDSRLMNLLRPHDLRVMVDLTGIQAAHDLRKRIEVSAPPGITTVHVDPEEVQVVFPPRDASEQP